MLATDLNTNKYKIATVFRDKYWKSNMHTGWLTKFWQHILKKTTKHFACPYNPYYQRQDWHIQEKINRIILSHFIRNFKFTKSDFI